ncbi:succinate dehydrogenase/fumarate reductase flavoprotein subunit [Arthrobacter globiformis]|uniref:FAD-dependent oxidoreductase n=1 Tax=Arthrobacter globiformis TaxID=1665 RepID=UPI0027892B94|nr:FAD-dependent oxidoreductase [Arthrobacter globiformis]MDQ1058246.1 succinate dehydrogenase/fumarate reductase flavoprotein subunit [Arthrobacter globiformis]
MSMGAPQQKESITATDHGEDSVDEVRRVDVVVVGSGVSGSAAAMTAARRGATVALLEKQTAFGGSAALSAGMFWTAPSVEAYRKRIPLGNVELGSRLVADYEDALAELRAAGLRVADEPKRDIMTFGIGYSTDIHGILAWCRDRIVAAGGEATAGAVVTGLVRNGCAVTGVLVRTADGRRIRYEAAAVVLASGGFQGDRAELTRSVGPNADRLVLRSNPGSVGDGLRLARAAGTGGTTAMSTFYGHLLPYPLPRFETEHYLPYSQYYSGSTVLVNLQGKRFADETDGDELLNQAVTFQPEARGILIFDEFVRSTEVLEEPFPGLGRIDRLGIAIEAGGQHAVAQTLPELVNLVAGWGVERDQLSPTLDRYAEVAGQGGGTADGVTVSASARAPQDGPFYALMVQPSITFTFGGVRTNTRGEALDHDGAAVPGLFAAGADIGGLSNYGYAGGLAPGYITGRWAGTSAAERAASFVRNASLAVVGVDGRGSERNAQ